MVQEELEMRLKVNYFFSIIVKPHDFNDQNTEASQYYMDMALLRKKKDNVLEILSSWKFNNIFARRQNDKYWNTVAYVQSNIKAKIGIGEKVNFLFLYDLFSKDEENEDPNTTSRTKSKADLSPKRNNSPLKTYEDINYSQNQVENLSGLQGQEL